MSPEQRGGIATLSKSGSDRSLKTVTASAADVQINDGGQSGSGMHYLEYAGIAGVLAGNRITCEEDARQQMPEALLSSSYPHVENNFVRANSLMDPAGYDLVHFLWNLNGASGADSLDSRGQIQK